MLNPYFEKIAPSNPQFYNSRAMVPESTAVAVSGQKTKTRVCDLDSRDPLWAEHKGSPFPTVAEAIQEDLDKYR